jgi:MFS family permease
MNKNFLLLWQGQLVSQLGSQAFSIGSLYWMMEQTGSAGQVGLMMVCATVPMLLISPFGGTLADHFSKKKTIITCDLLNGSVVLLFSYYLFTGSTDNGVHFLYATVFIGSLISGFFAPAILSAIPELVKANKVKTANSMMEISGQAAMLLGQGLGGVLYSILGAPLMFMIDGLSFIFSGLSECFLKDFGRKTNADTKEPTISLQRVVLDTRQGAHYIFANKGMRNFLLSSSLVNLLVAPLAVLLPFYVNTTLGKDAAWFGFLLASMGGGSLLGFAITTCLKLQGATRGLLIILCNVALSALLASLFWVNSPYVALLIMALIGVLSSITGVYTLTIIQLASDESLRGRVIGLVQSLSGATLPLGMALGGLLGELLKSDIPMVFLISGTSAAIVASLIPLNKAYRRFICQNMEM